MSNDFDESPTHARASKRLKDLLRRHRAGGAGRSTGLTGGTGTGRRIRRISVTDRLLSHPGRLSIAYFAVLIMVVTLLLLLPFATNSGVFTTFPVAFFTAVSALSTCGIPVVNTGEYWSTFGQVTILLSIQFGGLGVMTFASIIALGISRRMKVSQRILTANELGTTKLSEIKSVLAVVVGTSAVAEALTFALLLPDLARVNHGQVARTLWQALFYAVSAYNNTGFTPDATGLHVNRWGVGLPILISAFIGTLGFPVVLNLVRCARRKLGPRHWTLHTKLTLATTAILVSSSLIWFLLVEWNNTALFDSDDPSLKLRRAMSAAVMPRSAGFDTSWVPEVTDGTKVFMSAMMFIGAGSSSTAGGIRVTTFAVIILICGAAFTGHRDVSVFRRRIPRRVQMTAVSVATACFALIAVASMALMFVTGCDFVDAIFETCSAFSLGGSTVGVADAGNPATLFILAAAMIVGRLGPMTIAYAISRPTAPEPIRYPEESIIVG
jgi:Trk-type K+ transport system membrane component